jgi:hypothetical protein
VNTVAAVKFMLSIIRKLFSNNSGAATPVGHTRQVDLSGNIFSFAMPEDFSRDMPADDLVEQLDINDLEKFNDPMYGNLIRRWWDIKDAGFFGKNLGTVMMDISVQRVPENRLKLVRNTPYNISDRLDFLLMIDESLHQRYDEFVEKTRGAGDGFEYYIMSFATLLGRDLNSAFRDNIFNQQKWTAYSVGAPLNQMIVGYVLPISDKVYLEVIFTYSPNKNVFPREFRDVAYQKTDLVENSMQLSYVKNNMFGDIVGRLWLNSETDDVMEKNRDILLIPLFGPNIYKELAGYKKLIAVANKTFNQMDDDDQ